MFEVQTFAEFLRRIRAGDEEAATELVRRFEPVIRLEVRRRLNDPSLNRLFDSGDICQSVLLSFFVRARSGQYDLDQPGQLIGLLVGMARKKLAFHARKQHFQCRDSRRIATVDGRLPEAAARSPGPDSLVEARDCVRAFRRHLNEEERRLADLRTEGRTWPEIAAALGGNPQARRRQLERALDRAARWLGLDEVDHE